MHTGFFLGNPKGLGRPKHKWEYNIQTDLEETGSDGMGCT